MPSTRTIVRNGVPDAGGSVNGVASTGVHLSCCLATTQVKADIDRVSGFPGVLSINNSAVAPGTEVLIYRWDINRCPIIEGRAHTIEHGSIDGLPDLWRVRFIGEDTTRLRLVHGGYWQAHPAAMLRALTQEWRLCVQPELLFESPFPERR